MKPAKLLERARSSPAGLRFSQLCRLAEALGFEFKRQKGSHRIYRHARAQELLNFQNDGGAAKAYQVRQLLSCIDRLGLGLED